MKTFNPSSSHPKRAVQAWQILVGAAMHRQTLTYNGLSLLMYKKPAAGVMDKVLGHIAYYCIANKLPHLTSIVVGKGRGTPGEDIPTDLKGMDKKREKVYEYDWFNVYPPNSKKLLKVFNEYKSNK